MFLQLNPEDIFIEMASDMGPTTLTHATTSEPHTSLGSVSLKTGTTTHKKSGRFGTRSKNMFFSRNNAHPRHLRFINGVGGLQICAIKEDKFSLPVTPNVSSVLSDPRFSLQFPPNNYKENLLRTYADRLSLKKTKERVLPPLKFWTNSGLIVDDTSKWRNELEQLAYSVGLMTTNELKNATERLQKVNFPQTASSTRRKTSHSAELIKTPQQTSEYSRETGRLNETPKPLRTSRGRTSHGKTSKFVYCIDDNEREMWMIQVLCQILETDSMQDVQSWLVSAGKQEKDAARELIQKAINGLQESGRIQLDNEHRNSQQTQIDLDQIKDTIERISESQQKARPSVARSATLAESTFEPIQEETKADILKVEDIPHGAEEEDAQVKQEHESREQVLNNDTFKELEHTKLPSFVKYLTPVQKLLSQSVNFIGKDAPKEHTNFFDSEHDLLKKESLEMKRSSSSTDFFNSKKSNANDKKLSGKIIKELMNFVDIERGRNEVNGKKEAFPRIGKKNAQVLAFND